MTDDAILDPFDTKQPEGAGGSGIVDPFAGPAVRPTPAAEANPTLTRGGKPADSGDGDFVRGLKRTLPELKQLAGGTAALIGDTVGWDGLRDKGLQLYRDQEKTLAPLQKPTDSASEAWKQVKQGNLGAGVDFVQNAAGYTAGQAAESLVSAGAGALIGGVAGSEVPVAGNAAGAALGAVGGFVAKNTLKRGVKAAAEKLVEEQVAKGVAKDVAKKEAADFVAENTTKAALKAQVGKQFTERQLAKMGGAAAGGALGANAMNATMELGSIYPEAVDQAQAEGRTLDGGDLARVWGTGLAAAGVETGADLINLGKLFGGVKDAATAATGSTFKDAVKRYAGRAAREGGEAALREAGTEGVQTALERAGAGQSLTDAEAMRDYVDSMAVGAVGGVLFGGAAALHPQGEQQGTPKPKPKPLGQDPADALRAAVLDAAGRGDAAGLASAHAALVDHLQQAGRLLPGPTVSVDSAGNAGTPAQREAAVRAGLPQTEPVASLGSLGDTPDVQAAAPQHPGSPRYRVPFPGAATGSLADAANTLAAPAQESAPVQESFDAIPQYPTEHAGWADHLVQQAKAGHGFPQDEGDLAEAWHIPASDALAVMTQARARLEQEAPDALSRGSAAPGAEPAQLPVAGGADSVERAAVADHAPGSLGEAAATTAAHAPTPAATPAVPGAVAPSARPDTSTTSPAPDAAAGSRAAAAPAHASAPASAPAAAPGSEVPAASPSAQDAAAADQGAVTAAAHEAATSPQNTLPAPTEAQKEAGNYKKGHVQIGGLDVSIENPAGSQRRPEWPALAHHYGYIKGTIGKDKDHVDVFLTEHAADTSRPVFVVDQHNKDGGFDEHKVVLGAQTADEARAAYKANYSADWNGDGHVTQMTHAEFEAWVRDPNATQRPAAEAMPERATPRPAPEAAAPTTAPQQTDAADAGAHAEAAAASEASPTASGAGDSPQAGEGGASAAPVATAAKGTTGPDRFAPQGKKAERGYGKPASVVAELEKAGLNPDDYSIERTKEGGYVGVRKAATEAKAEAPKKGETHANATAPEHVQTEPGVTVPELREMAKDWRDYIDQGGTEVEHHLFDTTPKKEVVRLADKVRVYVAEHGWMTPNEAKAKVAEWKAHAQAQGQDPASASANSQKVVLSLFDLTGEWSKPWAEAGYQVYRFDIQDKWEYEYENPETGETEVRNAGDVRNLDPQFFIEMFGMFEGAEVHAILAACPCTDFAVSGARHFAAKDADGRTVSSVELVNHTLALIEYFKPAAWAIENPVGRIEDLTGLPPWRLAFDPNHLGDPYTKKTLIWGRFNGDLPVAPVEPTEGSKMHRLYGGKSLKTKNARSETPEGFSYGFFMANNAIDNPIVAVAGKYDRLDRNLIQRALDAGVTPKEIDELVEDFYYQDHDDAAANEALRTAAAGTNEDLADSRDHEARRQASLREEAAKLKAKKQPAKAAPAPTPTAGNKAAADEAASQPTNPVEAAMAERGMQRTGPLRWVTEGGKNAGTDWREVVMDSDTQWVIYSGQRDTKRLGSLEEVLAELDNPAPKAAAPSQFANNTLFTADKVEAAMARLRAKLGTVNSGIDPELLVDGMTIAGAYIESGVRAFGDYAKAMVQALGEGVKPYLLSFYEAARNYPGLSREGMDPHADAARQHAALLTPADLQSEAIGNPTPAPKRRAKPSRGGKRLTDDWGVDQLDGYTALPGKDAQQTDYGLKGGVKDAFLNEARGYLNDVADVLHDAGFTTPLDRKGKPGKPVHLSEGGPAGSGEAILHLDGPAGTGVEVWIGASALRGAVPSTASGVTVMYRTTRAGKTGANQWARTDLTAEQLAAELQAHVERSPMPATAAPKGAVARVLVNTVGRDGLTDAERAAGKAPLTDPLTEAEYKQVDGAAMLRLQQKLGIAPKSNSWAVGYHVLSDDAKARLGLAVRDLLADERTPASPDSAHTPAQEASSHVRPADDRQGDRPAAVRGGASDHAAEDRNDDAAAHLGAGQREEAARARAEWTTAADAPEGVPNGTGGGERGAAEAGAPDANRVPASRGTAADAVAPKADFTVSDELDFRGVGAVGKFKQNVAAIRLLQQLEAEGRRATPAEQSVLAKFVGWGGLPQAFRHPKTGKIAKGWEARVAELEALLTPEELAAAGRSTQDAHYTAATVVSAMWDAVARLGFDGGRVLEPSMGSGNFFGLMPHGLRSASALTGVELDSITGRIARQLYQTANVQVRGFNDLRIAPGSFDLAIGNPPFGSQSIHDPQYPEESKASIHNYFFAKSIASVRPGGVLAMVVSNLFLDANTSSTRSWIADRARFLGAIRLPQTAFQQNAGTNVTTDVVFLQRLADGEQGNPEAWVRVGSASDQGNAFALNRYFLDHPDMMLGRMVWSTHTTIGAAGAVLEAHPDTDLGEALAAAVAKLPAGTYQRAGKTIEAAAEHAAPRDAEVPTSAKVYGFYVGPNGVIHQRQPDFNGEVQAVPVTLSEAQVARVAGMARIRDLARDLLRAEQDPDASDASLDHKRAALNRAYDGFVKEHGLLSRDVNKRLFRDDPDAPLLLSLERDYDRGVSSTVAKKAGVAARKESAQKAALFTQRTNYPVKPVTEVADAKSAMLASLNERGRIDPEFMAGIYPGHDAEAIERELGELVFRTPEGALEPADAYLSGNVKAKLAAAQAAAAQDPRYARNVAALERVIPADVDAADIFVQLGTPWVPASDYADFAREVLEAKFSGSYSGVLGGWVVQVDGTNKTLNNERWGTDRMGADAIMEKLLGNKPVAVYDKGQDDKPILNEKDTAAAKGKAAELQQAFLDWLWKDTARRERLARHYNDTYNTDVTRKFDGSHMTFPGMNRSVLRNGNLRPHQAAFAYRMVQDGVALADHTVGAGKTYASIAGIMEMRRLGLWRKPMLAVPNHLVDQWATDFVRLYPGANVLAARRKDFQKGNRRKLFARIATGDWDAVIVAHSSFGFIPLPPDAERAMLDEEAAEILAAMDSLREGKKDLSYKQLQKRKEAVEERIKRMADRRQDDLIDFGEMGIDALTVDEAHEFKNLYFVTTQRNVAGLGSPEGSKKAFDLFVKMRHLANRDGGKNRVFLTGTPVSNTLSEVFHMQRYLQLEALRARGLAMFDTWAATFGQVVSDWEMDAAGRFKEKARFRKFANLPELVSLWRQVADTITMADLKRDAEAQGDRFPVPKIAGGKRQNITVPRSPLQAAYIGIPQPVLDGEGRPVVDPETGVAQEAYDPNSIIGRMENMPKDPSIDNHLKATGDARKASLDFRLVDPEAPDFAGSKVNVAVGHIARLWKENGYRQGTQLVFCDLSVPASARGKATEAALAKTPSFFLHDGEGNLTHVDGVKTSLSALPERPFFSVKGKHDYRIVEATSGQVVASGRTKQEAVDDANAKLAASRETWEQRFLAKAIPAEAIDAYVQAWEDAKAAKEAEGGEEEGEEGAAEQSVSLDELLADQSKHSVYDDMKAKLIAAGVPAAQIAFIHDYNTDLQKADLFAKVNRGEIRVLFGSTAKMGAGMNVQRKLVALHHMDAPWRPSDLTQREGRILRQGNEFYEADPEGFEVTLHAYGTEQTYDARQWEIIETKAKGIEDFQRGDGSLREIDDISSEAASAADMKGAASGNPLILESIKLRKEVRDLEAQDKAHTRARHSMESLVRSVDSKSAYAYARQADVQQLAAEYGPGLQTFALTLGGKTLTDPKELKVEPILAAFKQALEARDPVELGRFRGLQLVGSHRINGSSIRLELYAGKEQIGSTEFGREDKVNPAGFVTRLENIAKRLDELVPAADARVAQIEREAAQAREELKQPFPKAAELAAKRERQAKVVAALRAGRRDVEGDAPAAEAKFSRPDPARTLGPGAWFKQSQVVDESGRPRVVYHGTGEDFGVFEDRAGEATEHPSAGLGHFFTEDKPAAQYYAEVASKGVPADERIVDAYLSIQNPKRISLEDMQAFDHADEARAFREHLQRQGYDGIHVPESGIWIAFQSNQIKSASENNGDFDPANPDIRFSRPEAKTGGMKVMPLSRLIGDLTRDWGANAPRVYVLATADELPPYAKASQGWEGAEGYYDENTGGVYLVAANLSDARRAQQVLAHEVVGHYGIEHIVGDADWPALAALVRQMRASGKHAALFAELGRRYAGANDAIFVREAIAVMAEKGVTGGVVDRALAALRRFLRGLGFNLRWSEAELRALLAASARYVRDGRRPQQAAAAARTAQALQSRQAGTFYSALAESIERAQGAPKAATAAEWRGWLDGAQRRGEFRQSERDWLGLDAWLAQQGGKVSRQQLADFVRANEVQVRDVVLGDPASLQASTQQRGQAAAEAMERLRQAGFTFEEGDFGTIVLDRNGDAVGPFTRTLTEEQARDVQAVEDGERAGDPAVATKFASYQLPGGSDYRELLLTLPPREAGEEVDFLDAMPGEPTRGTLYGADDFRSSHFDQPNILAHVRFNTRTDADGKRVLFIEEIQSDWHQQGRKLGYHRNLTAAEEQEKSDLQARFDSLFDPLQKLSPASEEYQRIVDQRRQIKDRIAALTIDGKQVPDAPFKATDEWAMLAFKRMVRWAAEHGYDRIAWTTGAQQAARYDLSKQISRVEYMPAGQGKVSTLRAFDLDGRHAIIDKPGVTPEQIEEYVGKEVAQRLLDAKPIETGSGRKIHSVEGDGLRVGGEGMRAFYDKILPAAVNKWGKRFGAKVGQAQIPGKVTNPLSVSDAGEAPQFSGTESVHGIDLTPAMREAALQGQPLFSRPDPQATTAAVDAASQPPASVVTRVKDAFTALRENSRPTWLGALTLRHLAELGRDIGLKQVTAYADRVQQMATDRNVMQDEAAQVADPWAKFQRRDRAGADATANLMHDATIAGTDPAEDYRPLRTGATKRGPDEAVTRASIGRRVAAVEAELATASDAAANRLEVELAQLNALLAREEARKAAYPALVQRWLALPEAGRQLYVAAREAYTRQSERLEQAVIERILATGAAGRAKQEKIAELRALFESNRLEGPYFPLARFGEFWISATGKNGAPFFSLYENVQEWQKARRALAAQGFVEQAAGRKIAEARGVAGASTGFMADLEQMLDAAGVDARTRDDVWQLFLRSLPELSMRKHAIHRKKTAGYSKDALRAFASNMFHGSFQVARVRHTHELEAALLAMKNATAALAETDPDKAIKAAALTSEVNLRHEWVMNPKDSKAVSKLTGLGFLWYLGATPASALTNLTQTAIVTLPVLASRFGGTKAASALTNGMARALRNVDGDLTRGLSDEEKAAFKVWQASGALDHTAAHNLAGLSEQDSATFNPVARRTMQVVSWLFHRAELVNREATALAAFRLAREAGDDFATAAKYAEEVINESHFDYTNANRARFMQGNAAKVLLLFRQYSLNMTWLLWRNAYLSLRGESKEVRKAALVKLAGVTGMTALFAGTMGLPLMSVLFGIANAAAAAFGDDEDEPFDAEVAFRNFLADHLGGALAHAVTDGPVSTLTGADIGSRVSLNDLWLHDPDRELEGQAKADYLLEQMAGPVVGGMLVNTLRGMQLMEQGHTERGFETLLPKALKDGMKALRFATQGATTLRGDPLIEDLGVGGVALQLAGFSPTALAQRYDANNAAKNYERGMLERRQALLDAYALAWRADDADTLGKVRDKIIAWNEKNPALGITMATIRSSLVDRIRYSARAEGGVVLDRRVAEQAKAQARFAE